MLRGASFKRLAAGLMVCGAALIVLHIPSAAAACRQWDLSREFGAIQENGYNVVFSLSRPEGGRAHGTAEYYTGSDWRLVQGSASARMVGPDSFQIIVDWQNRTRGLYVGVIDAQGGMHGITKEYPLHSSSDVTWHSRQRLPCLVADRLSEPVRPIGKPKPMERESPLIYREGPGVLLGR